MVLLAYLKSKQFYFIMFYFYYNPILPKFILVSAINFAGQVFNRSITIIDFNMLSKSDFIFFSKLIFAFASILLSIKKPF